jgi:hypothetical protein
MEVSCWVIEQSQQGEHKSLNFLRTVKTKRDYTLSATLRQ